MITVGSATPKINMGCPPNIECRIPQMAVEAKVSTVLNAPSRQQNENLYITLHADIYHVKLKEEYQESTHSSPVSLLSCSPKAITGRAEAKKMYIVGANILGMQYYRIKIKFIKIEERSEDDNSNIYIYIYIYLNPERNPPVQS